MTHTPEPWSIIAEPGMTIIIAAEQPTVDGKFFGIALIPHGDDANAIPWDVKESNARLIAMAPELLREVMGAIVYAKHDADILEGRDEGDDLPKRLRDYATRLEAIVARAT